MPLGNPQVIDFTEAKNALHSQWSQGVSVPMPVVYFTLGALTAAVVIYAAQAHTAKRKHGYVI